MWWFIFISIIHCFTFTLFFSCIIFIHDSRASVVLLSITSDVPVVSCLSYVLFILVFLCVHSNAPVVVLPISLAYSNLPGALWLSRIFRIFHYLTAHFSGTQKLRNQTNTNPSRNFLPQVCQRWPTYWNWRQKRGRHLYCPNFQKAVRYIKLASFFFLAIVSLWWTVYSAA